MKTQSTRERWREIIWETETTAGKQFDVLVIFFILLSVFTAMLASVRSIDLYFGNILRTAEWVFTILFTLEYLARVWTVPSATKYATSYFGIIDLVAVLPSYLSLVLPGAEYLIVIRALRVMRVFRILRLFEHVREAELIVNALKASRNKILVFLIAVLVMVTILGSLMYLVEGEENGYTSIPTSIYWAVVTLTTVGYGDISPKTPIGQLIACVMMFIGFGIIAVPTGIVTAEIARTSSASSQFNNVLICPSCAAGGHLWTANFCYRCGKPIGKSSSPG